MQVCLCSITDEVLFLRLVLHAHHHQSDSLGSTPPVPYSDGRSRWWWSDGQWMKRHSRRCVIEETTTSRHSTLAKQNKHRTCFRCRSQTRRSRQRRTAVCARTNLPVSSMENKYAALNSIYRRELIDACVHNISRDAKRTNENSREEDAMRWKYAQHAMRYAEETFRVDVVRTWAVWNTGKPRHLIDATYAYTFGCCVCLPSRFRAARLVDCVEITCERAEWYSPKLIWLKNILNVLL